MIKSRKLLALLLALSFVIALAGCTGEPEPAESEEPSESSGPVIENPMGDAEIPVKLTKRGETIEDYYKLNEDTVGWLEVPGTHIDDVVVCNTDPDDYNDYYYRRDFEKNYSFNGVFYADFRSDFGNGTAEELPINTIIYGHTMKEDPEDVMFAPLLHFMQDEDFARETPYIFFSTAAEDMVFEVFAVSFATVDLPYNRPDLPESEHLEAMNEVIKRSMYTYEMEPLTTEDKILTLSTCTYNVPGIGPVSYPNDYRYIIMARLVDSATATKRQAEFTVNPSPKEP